jgi:hydroxylamine reductase
MEFPMFCYQCEQTSQGHACLDFGVCGKEADVAMLQDLLVYQLEGLAVYAQALLEQGKALENDIHFFTIDALFSTLTNVNFSAARFYAFLRQAQQIKEDLRSRAALSGKLPDAALYNLPGSDEAIQSNATLVNIRPQAASDPDVQSLKDTLLFGIKGMAAYAHHAWVLGYRDDAVNAWLYKGLSAMLDMSLGLNDLVGLVMEFGKVNLACMELLDRANTESFGHPEPSRVRITPLQGPFIVVSGHDLHDLHLLLEQTAGKGINIYTHGEMLPANAYPAFKKYPHLAGNFGGAWQVQQREFDSLPGAILMTTNCLMEPRQSYQDRLFTTGVVGFDGIAHIEPGPDGSKDFSAVIARALELGGFPADQPEQTLLTGFARQAVLSHAGEIIQAVKSGQIRHFFLVGGCDGAKAGRNYYTQFAEQSPQDTVVLTLACGKYRFIKEDLGTVAGLPRLLDVGQCNDAYSAIQIALALAGAFECGVNDLPLTLVLSWYEQKAVCILLTLLSLGIKNIYLGPSLPAFITPNVLNFLVQQFQIKPISNVETDMAAMLA